MKAAQSDACVWKKAIDQKTSRVYYYHVHTHEIRYKVPLELATPAEREVLLKEREEQRKFFLEMENLIKRRIISSTTSSSGATTSSTTSAASYLDAKHGSDEGTGSSSSRILEKFNREYDSLSEIEKDYWDNDEASSKPSSRMIPITRPSCSSSEYGARQLRSSRSGSPLERSFMEPRPFRTISTLDFNTLSLATTGSVADLNFAAGGGGGSRGPIEDRRLSTPRKRSFVSLETMKMRSGSISEAADAKGLPRSMSRTYSQDDEEVGAKASAEDKLHLKKASNCLRRINSTGTIYINSTMSRQNDQVTIRCVCLVIRAHIIEARSRPSVPRGAEIFTDAAFQAKTRSLIPEKASATPPRSLTSSLTAAYSIRGSPPNSPAANVNTAPSPAIPKLDAIFEFFNFVFQKSQLESECIIIALIYMERLVKDTSGGIQIRHDNYRSIIFACLVMASKVWDDLSMWNVDFSHVSPAFNLERINALEVAVLRALRFSIKVTAGEYAKYYFLLRSMISQLGLDGGAGEKDMAPLDMVGARQLQLASRSSIHFSGANSSSARGNVKRTLSHLPRRSSADALVGLVDAAVAKDGVAVNAGTGTSADSTGAAGRGNTRRSRDYQGVSLEYLMSNVHTDADGIERTKSLKERRSKEFDFAPGLDAEEVFGLSMDDDLRDSHPPRAESKHSAPGRK